MIYKSKASLLLSPYVPFTVHGYVPYDVLTEKNKSAKWEVCQFFFFLSDGELLAVSGVPDAYKQTSVSFSSFKRIWKRVHKM